MLYLFHFMQMHMEVHGILLEGLKFIMQVMLLKILKMQLNIYVIAFIMM